MTAFRLRASCLLNCEVYISLAFRSFQCSKSAQRDERYSQTVATTRGKSGLALILTTDDSDDSTSLRLINSLLGSRSSKDSFLILFG